MATVEKKSLLEIIAPVYKASKRAKHNWKQFVDAVIKDAGKDGFDAGDNKEKKEAKIKSAFSNAIAIGIPLEKFEGQESGGRGRQAKDYSSVAKMFGLSLDEEKHAEYKAKQEKQKPANIIEVLKKFKGKMNATQIKTQLAMRPETLQKKLDDMKAKGKLIGVPELEIV